MSITSADIFELRDRLKRMIEQIEIEISDPVPIQGRNINPGELFTVKILASNPWFLNFKNIKWEVKIVSLDKSHPIACLVVPEPPPITQYSPGGNILKPGRCVNKIVLSYPDMSTQSCIPPQGKTEIQVEGKTNKEIDDTVVGKIEARIYADVDLDFLFAFGAPSDIGDSDLEIVF